MTTTSHLRLSPYELEQQRRSGHVSIIDVREPMEYVVGHIPGSRNIPLALLTEAPLPDGPLVLICQSGTRSERGVATLARRGLAVGIASLEGGLMAWQDAQLPIEKRKGAPLALMRQVQIVAGGLVLIGVVLSQIAGPGWIWLSGFVGAGLIFAGISGFCGMARLLALMPWNRVRV